MVNFKEKRELDVGSYKVTLAQRISALSSIKELALTEESTTFLQRTYPEDKYIFMCCRLRDDAASREYEPLACSFPMPKQGLFVPTMHFHPGAKNEVDWDHLLTFFVPEGVYFPDGYCHPLGQSLIRKQSPVKMRTKDEILENMALQPPRDQEDEYRKQTYGPNIIKDVYQFGYEDPIVQQYGEDNEQIWEDFQEAMVSILEHFVGNLENETSYTVTMIKIKSSTEKYHNRYNAVFIPNGDIWIKKTHSKEEEKYHTKSNEETKQQDKQENKQENIEENMDKKTQTQRNDIEETKNETNEKNEQDVKNEKKQDLESSSMHSNIYGYVIVFLLIIAIIFYALYPCKSKNSE